jgi:hypothetical protein
LEFLNSLVGSAGRRVGAEPAGTKPRYNPTPLFVIRQFRSSMFGQPGFLLGITMPACCGDQRRM